MHRGPIISALTLSIALAWPSSATASVYSDDLGKCLIRETSDLDKQLLVKWIFSAVSAGPVVQPLANISAAQRVMFDKDAAALSQRLMAVNCRRETVEAIKYDGNQAVESGFSLLGQVAMRGMMNDPKVTAALEAYVGYFDTAKMKALFEEAGVATKIPQPAK